MSSGPLAASAPVAAVLPRRTRRERLAATINRHIGLVYLAPATLVLFFITIVPLCYLLYNSLTQWNLMQAYLGRSFVGLDNYAAMLSDSQLLASINVTILAAAGVVILELTLGMLLALLFSRECWGKRVLRSLFLLPLITTPVVVGLTWRMLYNSEFGMIDYFLKRVGLPAPIWLASPQLALPSIIVTDAWNVIPFITLMFVAGLQSLPAEPYEAAKVDGASAWQRFVSITLPLLRPLIFLALIFRVTDALRMFDLIYVMTSGGPANATQTLNMYAFKVGFSFLNMGYGSAIATVLMLVCILVSLVMVRYSGLDLGRNT